MSSSEGSVPLPGEGDVARVHVAASAPQPVEPTEPGAGVTARLRGLADAALEIAAAGGVDDVLRAVTEAAQEIVGTHHAVTSRLVNGWTEAATFVSLSDKYEAYRTFDRVPWGLGVLNEVTRENRPLRLTGDELRSHAEWRALQDAPDHPPLPSYLAAPLVGRDRSNLGLIQLADKVDGSAFTAEDESMLVQLAQMASGAIERLELLERERAARREAERALSERTRLELVMSAQKQVFEQIASGAPLSEVLETLTRLIERFSRHDVLPSILLLDPDGLHLRHGAAPALPDAYNVAIDGIEIGPALGSCGTAAYRDATVVVSDIETDPLWAEFRDLALAHGLRACWSTPMHSGDGTVLGTFACYYEVAHEPDQDDRLLVDVFSRAAAVAIQRARDLAAIVREKRVVETVHRLGQVITSRLDLKEIVQVVTDAGTQLTHAEFGAFFYNVVREGGETYTLYASSGAPREAFERFPMPRNTAIFEPTFRGTDVVRLADVTADPRYGHNPPYAGMPEGHIPVRSYLAVPVVATSAEVIGGLFFGHPEPGVFTQEDERMAVGIAAQAGIALQNARLYEREHRIAVTLRQSMLPPRLPVLEGAALAARYVPGSRGLDVGGDWYDAITLSDGTLMVSVGDVIGRGLGAAAVMGQLRNAVRAYALEGLSPAQVIARVNGFLEALTDCEFATLVVVAFDPETGHGRLATAGHPPPLLVGPERRPSFLGPSTGPALIGAVWPDASWGELTFELEPGDTLLLYTDGLVEGRARGLEEGLGRLREVAGKAPADLEALLDHVLGELDGRDDRQEDDVAILALRAWPSGVPPLELRLSADPGQLRGLRLQVGEWLASAGASRDEAYEVTLACWEACVNAVEHPESPARSYVELRATSPDPGVIEVVVRDFGTWREQQHRGNGRGRGLLVARGLMDEVTVRPSEAGTEVRMRRRLRSDRPDGSGDPAAEAVAGVPALSESPSTDDGSPRLGTRAGRGGRAPMPY